MVVLTAHVVPVIIFVVGADQYKLPWKMFYVLFPLQRRKKYLAFTRQGQLYVFTGFIVGNPQPSHGDNIICCNL